MSNPNMNEMEYFMNCPGVLHGRWNWWGWISYSPRTFRVIPRMM
jgi:hypothetical protein